MDTSIAISVLCPSDSPTISSLTYADTAVNDHLCVLYAVKLSLTGTTGGIMKDCTAARRNLSLVVSSQLKIWLSYPLD